MKSHMINPFLPWTVRKVFWSAVLIGYGRSMTTAEIIKGKSVQVSVASPRHMTVREKSPDKHWCRPPQGFVKLTVDGSFHATDGSAGAGMALHDDQGIVIFTACRFMNNCSGPLEAVTSQRLGPNGGRIRVCALHSCI
jgi:hypothetical protein